MNAGLAGLIVGLLSVGLGTLYFVLGERSARRNRELLGKVHNLIKYGADHVKVLADKMTFRGTVSARVIRKDGTTVDLGELKPPR